MISVMLTLRKLGDNLMSSIHDIVICVDTFEESGDAFLTAVATYF